MRHGDGVGGHSRVVVLLESEGRRAGDKDATGAGRQAAEFICHIGQGEGRTTADGQELKAADLAELQDARACDQKVVDAVAAGEFGNLEYARRFLLAPQLEIV